MTTIIVEKWPSGLRRHPAKVLYGAICTVGSNPTFSVFYEGVMDIFQSLVFAVVACAIIIGIKLLIFTLNFNKQPFATIERNYKEQISKNPSNIIAYNNLITLYLQHKRYDDAGKYLEIAKTLKINNKHFLILLRINESTLLIHENKLAEAKTLIEETLPMCKGLFYTSQRKVLFANLEFIKMSAD